MHELSITQSMFDIIMAQAREADAEKVEKINLVIGELTGVVGDCVQFYFNFISKDTLAEGATLSFTMVPPKVQCQDCDKISEIEELNWFCPYCGSQSLKIIAGKELFVESIEVK